MNKAIQSPLAPPAVGPYSQAVQADSLLFVSGQLPLDPASGRLAEDSIEEQTHRSLKNIRAILEQAGLTMDHVVKTTVYLKDIDEFSKMNQVYSEYFGGAAQPARAAFQVAALPKGARVEIEAIAVK